MSDYENHHVAGRRNHDLTVQLCTPCHRRISRWQRAIGVPLTAGDRTETQRMVSLLVGVCLLGENLFRIYGRMIARSAGYQPRSTFDRDGGD